MIEILVAMTLALVTFTTGLAVFRGHVRGDVGLDQPPLGDSAGFDGKGIADLSGAGGPLGHATFAPGSSLYDVRFNSVGASRVTLR